LRETCRSLRFPQITACDLRRCFKVLNAPEFFEHFAELNAFLLKHLAKPLATASSLPNGVLKDIEVPETAAYQNMHCN